MAGGNSALPHFWFAEIWLIFDASVNVARR